MRLQLVREAGGEVTRFNGDPYDPYGLQILATNGKVHNEARLAIEEAWTSVE